MILTTVVEDTCLCSESSNCQKYEPIRRSIRIRKPPNRYEEFYELLGHGNPIISSFLFKINMYVVFNLSRILSELKT